MEYWSNGEEKTEYRKNEIMKGKSVIYEGFDQYSNTPLLQHSITPTLQYSNF